MAIVVDASVMLAHVLGEPNATAERARRALQDESAAVPALWWYETRNVLIVNERRRRILQQDTAGALREWANLNVVTDTTPDEAAVISLARKHRLTVYDAAYLELALRERLPLATLGGELAQAARAEGVAVLE